MTFTKEAVEDHVFDFISELSGRAPFVRTEDLGTDTKIEDLGFDEIDVMDLILMADDVFGTDTTGEEERGLNDEDVTVQSVIDLYIAKLKL